MKKVRKAVIPAAGHGTRFLPVTKALPKEMLALIDTPAVQYVAQEAADRALQVLDTGKCDEDPHMQFQLCTKDDIETYKEYWGIE